MSADADTHHAKAARAVVERLQVVERGACIVIVGRNLFGGLVSVSAVGTGLIVRQHGSGGLQLVIDLRSGYHVAMTRQHDRCASNRPGNLKDFGIEQDARILSGGQDGRCACAWVRRAWKYPYTRRL